MNKGNRMIWIWMTMRDVPINMNPSPSWIHPHRESIPNLNPPIPIAPMSIRPHHKSIPNNPSLLWSVPNVIYLRNLIPQTWLQSSHHSRICYSPTGLYLHSELLCMSYLGAMSWIQLSMPDFLLPTLDWVLGFVFVKPKRSTRMELGWRWRRGKRINRISVLDIND